MTKPQPRYDMGPVLEQTGNAPLMVIARRVDIPVRQLTRWMRLGIPYWSADRVATRLYRSPGELWPEWETGEPSPAIVDYVTKRKQEKQAAQERAAADQVRRAEIRASFPPTTDLHDIKAPGDFHMPRLQRPAGAVAPQAGVSDDLVYIFPEWLANSPIPPGLPPRKEDAVLCECSLTDDIGRPLHIGWCCRDNCERRPA